jgi:hypothetical protein
MGNVLDTVSPFKANTGWHGLAGGGEIEVNYK